MKKRADWKSDFKKGEKFEKKFYEWYQQNSTNKIEWLQEKYEADFLINNFKVELKSDFTEHSNFFLEYFSNMETNRQGGPWQAAKYNAKYFIYWFVDERNKNQWNCYSFKTKELLEWMSIHKNEYQTRKKENDGFTTLGIIVPVNELSNQKFCTIKIVEVK